VVRIVASQGDVTSFGSGTLVWVTDDYGLVITNWHVVRRAEGAVEVIFPDGFRSGGTVMKLDNAWDLAAIGIWRPPTRPVKISTTAPRPGESLTIAGYGGGEYRAAVGRCTQYVAPGMHHPFEMVELSAEARQGDSGGPIFNARGELAGVLLGAKQGHTVGSFCGRVDHFLTDVARTLEQKQAELIGVEGQGRRHVAAALPDDKIRNRLVPIKGRPNQMAARSIPAAESPPNGWDWLPESDARATPRASGSHLAWGGYLIDFLGATPLDQVKTFLAILGAFALVIGSLRFFKIEA
jgi:hypothetical protein